MVSNLYGDKPFIYEFNLWVYNIGTNSFLYNLIIDSLNCLNEQIKGVEIKGVEIKGVEIKEFEIKEDEIDEAEIRRTKTKQLINILSLAYSIAFVL